MSDPRGQRRRVSQEELQQRVGAIAGASALNRDQVRGLVEALRWASREVRGGMDNYVRVRAAARADACGRAADELERLAGEGNGALLALAARLRARSVDGDLPPDVKPPTLWRADRPVPALDPSRMQREQRIGFALGLAHCAAQIHLAAGGKV